MNNAAKFFLVAVVAFGLMQFIRPSIPEGGSTAEIATPPEVKRILEKSCYSCHSNEKRLAWFDQIVPGYWLVQHDIITARRHLNFSTLASKPIAAQRATLFEAVNMMQLGAMPLAQFRQVHPEANFSNDDLAVLKKYLAPWKPVTNTQPPADAAARPNETHAIQAEFNGLPFDSDYRNWRIISVTDRGDNDTFRFILGNSMAMAAAKSGRVSPWPDGSRFAKVAWHKYSGSDGLVHVGEFVQVELMAKEAGKYRSAAGWGWGRWRGLELHPYGKDASFVDECTTCHLPVRGNDDVYTLPITAAQVHGQEVVNNNASLPARLPFQPLDWEPASMFVDPNTRTIAVLFVNDIASKAAHERAPGSATVVYPTGSVLALVTWSEREDPHWFGARIPDRPASAEFCEFGSEGDVAKYSRFIGPDLKATEVQQADGLERARVIAAITPATLPD